MACQTKLSIGWVGLGAMGFGMAANLVKHGHKVTAYDVFPQALEKFEQAGGTSAKSLRESAVGKSLYVCMVATAVQLNQLMFDGNEPLVKTLEKGVTFLVTSTVAAAEIVQFENDLKSHGRDDIFLVDCPVSGGSRRAANGTLSIMAGGSKQALANAHELLSEMSDPGKLFFPGEIGQGSNLKMVHQVLACIQIATNSEALAFASWLNLDLEEVRNEVIKPGSKAYSWMFENRSPRTIENRLKPPESSMTIIIKDTAIITQTARKNQYPVPLCTTAEQVYLSGLMHGWAGDDDGTLARLYCPNLEPPPKASKRPIENSEEKANAIQMVLNLMIGIHTVAVAETVGFAHCVGLQADMVMKLVNEAAGATWAFAEHAKGMFLEIESKGSEDVTTEPLASLRTSLAETVVKARNISCPLFLGNAALEVMTQTERNHRNDEEETSILDLVKFYT